MSYASFARFYDTLTENIDYNARANYFDELIRRHTGAGFVREENPAILLDLACGTGSLSLEMANLGYDVIGVDASADMLSVAMNKAAEREKNILFLRQPMEKLDLFGTVDVCICALDSLNHLPSHAALCKVLDRIALFVGHGGLFIFDVNTQYKHRQILADNTFIYDTPTVYCVWQNSLRDNDNIEITLDFFEHQKNGSYARHSEQFTEILLPPEMLERELLSRGFNIQSIYGDDSFNPPREDTQRLIYITIKE